VIAVLVRELGSLGARHALYVVRLALLLLLGLVLGITLLATTERSGAITFREMSEIGHAFFVAFFVTELILIWLLMASMTSGVIATERENRTLDLLLMTPAGPMRILFGKFLSRIAVLLFLIASSAPFLFAGIALGGIGTGEIWTGLYHVVGHGVLACGITFLFSATTRNSRNASSGPIVLLILTAILLPVLEGLLRLTGARMPITLVVHPFWVSIGTITGYWKGSYWSDAAPSVWMAIGVGAALLAARIVAFRTYVNPVEHVSPRARTKRSGAQTAAAVARVLALVGVASLALYIALGDSVSSRNNLGERPIYLMILLGLFAVIYVRRVRTGITQGQMQSAVGELRPNGNPMAWKEARFLGFNEGWRGDIAMLGCFLICLMTARETHSSNAEGLVGSAMGCAVTVGILFVLGHFSAGLSKEREKKSLDLLILTTAPRGWLVDAGWIAALRALWPLGVLLVASMGSWLFDRSFVESPQSNYAPYNYGWRSQVNIPQVFLSMLVFAATIVLHGYFAVWIATRTKKASTAVGAAIALPLLAYTVLPMLEGMLESALRMFRGDAPLSLAINPFFLTIELATSHRAMTLSFGVTTEIAGLAYVVAAFGAVVLLRKAALRRLDQPPAV